MSIKPILFNTDMVRAILDGRKMVTRRVVKPQLVCHGPDITFTPHSNDFFVSAEKGWIRCRDCGNDPEYSKAGSSISHHWEPPYKQGDILYVRETWNRNPLNEYGNEPDKYIHKATYDGRGGEVGWHPSIHMPKEAARIWLKATNVRVERLQDMPHDAAGKEGVHYCESPDGFTWKVDSDMNCCYVTPSGAFEALWNGTVNKDDMDRYGWEANPWVWVIEFERCEKPEEVEF